MNDIKKAIQEWIESYEGDNLKKRVLITAYPKIVEFVERARQDERKKIREELERNGLFHEFVSPKNGRVVILIFDKEFWDFFWSGERGEVR